MSRLFAGIQQDHADSRSKEMWRAMHAKICALYSKEASTACIIFGADFAVGIDPAALASHVVIESISMITSQQIPATESYVACPT